MIYNLLEFIVFRVENKDKDAIIFVVIVMNQQNHIIYMRAC